MMVIGLALCAAIGAYLGSNLVNALWARYMADGAQSRAPVAEPAAGPVDAFAWHVEEMARARALGFGSDALAQLKQVQAADIAATCGAHVVSLSTR